MTTYGIMTDDGEMLFKGYYTESDARAFCERLDGCRVVKVSTTVEVTEI